MKRRAFALVTVLIVLALLTGLILGFFMLASSESKSAGVFRSGGDGQELARAAADVVIAQIRAATTEEGSAWASQPGAIRTYSAGSKPGEPAHRVYKLYSSGTLTVSGTGFNAALEVPPANWASQPGLFVNLNRPANGHYPIADPAALEKVEGFEVTDNAFKTDLAMPVRWLYVLQDGSMVAPESQSGSTVSFPAGKGPTKANPVVGRVAFWADDESAKVNVNTAGGDVWESPASDYAGSYWSPPYAHSEFDQKKLALSQPYQREYQRYPGHPGTVHLSAIFPDLSLEQILSLTPRYRFGGSKGGTVDLNTSGSALAPKAERLYATVDELIYETDRDARSLISAERLEESRFFLTANSRSSDLNLFGLPKVAAWPIHRRTGSQYRTAFDETIAFCMTLEPEGGPADGYEYFFTRNRADDPQGDFNTRNSQLYGYLERLIGSQAPGFATGSKTLSVKWGAADKQILTQVYDYIRSTNLADSSTNSILPFAMENPASSVSLESAAFGQVVPTRLPNGTSGFGRYPLISEFGFLVTLIDENSPELTAAKTAVPSLPEKTIRRWYRVVLLVELFTPAQGFAPLGLDLQLEFGNLASFTLRPGGANSAIYGPNTAVSGTAGYQVFPNPAETLVLEQYSGRGVMHPDLAYYPRGWGGALNPFSLLYRANPVLSGSNVLKDFTNGQSGPDFYPLVSPPFCVDTVLSGTATTADSVCRFNGFAPSVVQRDPHNQFPVQYNFAFPPIPAFNLTRKADTVTGRRLDQKFSAANPYTFLLRDGSDRLRTVSLNQGSAARGDVRQLFGSPAVAATDYDIGNNYSAFTSNQYDLIHGFQGGDNFRWGMAAAVGTRSYFTVGAGSGSAISSRPNSIDLVALAASPWPVGIVTPSGTVPGDWDSGIGPFNDGAYINKPDDGSTRLETKVAGEKGFYTEPYFRNLGLDGVGDTYFSPNRIMVSPVLFGSLPTGLKRGLPWQTLLFTPGPAAGSNHPGLADGLPDHLLLDLFGMPVVDPYAISEPFSTAGRVNLNTGIVPFTYIRRDTALRAALRGIRVPVISGDDLGGSASAQWVRTDPFLYKATFAGSIGGSSSTAGTAVNPYIYHRPVDLDTTLDGFRQRMDADNPFRSATEICEMFLVPDLRRSAGSHFLNSGLGTDPNLNTGSYDAARMRAFWTATGNGLKWSGLTGDNLRERPYALLYPLVTTKSNTFTVHVIAQVVKNPPGTPDGQYIEWADAVRAEWQGSFLVERQLSATDARLVDYATKPNTKPTPESLHKIRVLHTRRFTPGALR